MTAALSPEAAALVLEALERAPRGGRTAAVREAARRFGVSPATVWRAVGGGPARRRKAGRPEYREWVRIAVGLARRAPRPAPLEVALRAAVEGGDLPPEAASMPLGTAYRVARELGLEASARRRTPRVSAEWPMQAVLIDASTSMHLAVDRRAAPGDDDPPLKLHRSPVPAGGYKNKPLPPDGRRLWVYGVWDLCTGYVRSRYAAARGESALDALEFLCWALAEHEDRRVVMHGVPDDLWSDQGPLVHSAAALGLLRRLGVEPVTSAPHRSERMGGVERAHRARWARFERSLFLGAPERLRVSALNARLLEYEIAENARRPSRTAVDGRVLSRAAAWTALTRRRPADRPLRRLPPDPLGTLAVEARRRVDRGGLVRWGGRVYESPWHDRAVIARRAADGGGDIALEDEATGERTVASVWRPRPYGEARAPSPTPAERLDADPAVRALSGSDVWAPAAGPPRVVPLPAPAAPAAALENPLPAGMARCRDLAEAWRVFGAVYPWPLSGALRARVERRFEAAGLERAAVVDLARELAAAGEAARKGA